MGRRTELNVIVRNLEKVERLATDLERVDVSTSRLARSLQELNGANLGVSRTLSGLVVVNRDVAQAINAGQVATIKGRDARRAETEENRRAEAEMKRYTAAVKEAMRQDAATAAIKNRDARRAETEETKRAEAEIKRHSAALREQMRFEQSATDLLQKSARARRDVVYQLEKMEMQQAKVNAMAREELRLSRERMAESAGRGMLVAGTAGALALGHSVKTAGDFDTNIRDVNSIAHLTEEQLQKLRKSALDLVDDPLIRQGPKDLAKGLYEVYSSGFAGGKALEVLKISAQGAGAGMTDTATSAKGLMAVLNSGIEGVTGTRQAMDLLFQEVNLGVNRFEGLANAIGTILPVAKAAGITLQEVLAGLAALTRRGYNIDEAETALRQMINHIVKPSREAEKVLRDVGISYGIAGLKAKGLIGILQEMSEKTEGNKQKLIAVMPEIRAMGSLLSLTDKQGTQYKDMLVGILKATDDVGAMTRAAQEQAKGAGAQYDKLKQSVERLEIEIGEKLLPTGLRLAKWTKDQIDGFNRLSPAAQTAAVTVAAIGTAALVAGGFALTFGVRIRYLINELALLGITGSSVGARLAGMMALVNKVINPVTVTVGALSMAGPAGIGGDLPLGNDLGKRRRDLQRQMSNAREAINTFRNTGAKPYGAGLGDDEYVSYYESQIASAREGIARIDAAEKQRRLDAAAATANKEAQKAIDDLKRHLNGNTGGPAMPDDPIHGGRGGKGGKPGHGGLVDLTTYGGLSFSGPKSARFAGRAIVEDFAGAAQELGIGFGISPHGTNLGQHAKNSRHYKHNALDANTFRLPNGRVVRIDSQEGLRFWQTVVAPYFEAHDFEINPPGGETGHPRVILGPAYKGRPAFPGHRNHIHGSDVTGTPVGKMMSLLARASRQTEADRKKAEREAEKAFEDYTARLTAFSGVLDAYAEKHDGTPKAGAYLFVKEQVMRQIAMRRGDIETLTRLDLDLGPLGQLRRKNVRDRREEDERLRKALGDVPSITGIYDMIGAGFTTAYSDRAAARLRDIDRSARPNLYGIDQDAAELDRLREKVKVIEETIRLLGDSAEATRKWKEQLDDLNTDIRNLTDKQQAEKLKAFGQNLGSTYGGIGASLPSTVQALSDRVRREREEAQARLRTEQDDVAYMAAGAGFDFYRGNRSAGEIIRDVGDQVVYDAMYTAMKGLTDPLVLAMQENTRATDANTQAQGGGTGAGGGKSGGTTSTGKRYKDIGKLAGLEYAQLAAASYSIFQSGAQNGITLGGLIGSAGAGASIGSAFGPAGAAIGAIAGGALGLFGGLFGGGKKKQDPHDGNPAYYAQPGGFEYNFYRYHALGMQPDYAALHAPDRGPIVVVVENHVDGVKRSVETHLAKQTATGSAALVNSHYDFYSPR